MKTLFNFIIILLIINIYSCTEIKKLLKYTGVQKPRAEIENVRLNNLSLEEAHLVSAIKISNPNSFGINLSGFDYNLTVNENSFLKGKKSSELKIAADSEGNIQFPLTLNFNDLYQSYIGLKGASEIIYKLDLGLDIDLPALGKVRIPISKTDTLPALRKPEIRLRSAKVINYSLSSVDLIIHIEVDNPNRLDLTLDNMDYNLRIEGKTIALGQLQEKFDLKNNDKKVLELPFTVNYVEVGKSLVDMIRSDRMLKYQFSGKAEISSTFKFLKEFKFPFQKSGELNFSK